MIPNSFLQAWSHQAPWPDSRQIEQDLIICRALCDLFNHSVLKGRIAFRGGTAINKLLFKRPLRYSEDIDLVQTAAEPIGTTVDAIRDALSWLGKCNRDQAGHSMHLVFRFTPESEPGTPLKLKVEINTREHNNLYGLKDYPFSRAVAEQRMLAKLARSLTEDIAPLLPGDVTYSGADALEAFESVWMNLITQIKGEPWKLTRKTIADLREQGFPGLLKRVDG